MDCKSSSTKLACVVAFLLFAYSFQLLSANKEFKSTDELNALQLPISQDADVKELDGVNHVFITRYDRPYAVLSKKCRKPQPCGSDSDCADSPCGIYCVMKRPGESYCRK